MIYHLYINFNSSYQIDNEYLDKAKWEEDYNNLKRIFYEE